MVPPRFLADKTLALVYMEPPSPQLLHGYYNIGATADALRSVVRAGAGAAKEIEARRASARLDSAVARVDVPARLAQRTGHTERTYHPGR